jgi:hypothetical protein
VLHICFVLQTQNSSTNVEFVVVGCWYRRTAALHRVRLDHLLLVFSIHYELLVSSIHLMGDGCVCIGISEPIFRLVVILDCSNGFIYLVLNVCDMIHSRHRRAFVQKACIPA